ncbi:two component transcriptional regulator, LuxR family [Marinobacter daqiaonensis]|uniref:Two component transcriptional regulator, LuxR family n=1 Tax=Marinobacter daqiaonensis TaxID=650891 RepID=A0A1I6I644_9GAMM|nr:response regulator transcription factor [Marinobacter daqiaonensis]SFR61860.1 two component transcriptional regulator, LuxR family [Marinobacter daqiaonensis]
MIRIAIVEDSTPLRENLRLLLEGDPGFDVVAACGDGESLMLALDTVRPDLLLCDLNLPGMSGLTVIAEAKARLPGIEILAHTINEDRGHVFGALRAGATGYILKGTRPAELIDALHTLRNGGAPMTPRIARALVREFQADAPTGELLSRKERDVLMAVQEGLTYKETAVRLNISPHTVHSHIKKIYEKLQARDKQDALVKARRQGLI